MSVTSISNPAVSFIDIESAKQIVKEISKTVSDYSVLLSKLEQEKAVCEAVDNELKRIGMQRGFSEEEWKKGISLKDRWKVEDKLYRSNSIPTPPNDTVLNYIRSALDHMLGYSEILEKMIRGDVLFVEECSKLIKREEINKQLSYSIPLLEKPFNVANGDRIAADIESFCEKNADILVELVTDEQATLQEEQLV